MKSRPYHMVRIIWSITYHFIQTKWKWSKGNVSISNRTKNMIIRACNRALNLVSVDWMKLNSLTKKDFWYCYFCLYSETNAWTTFQGNACSPRKTGNNFTKKTEDFHLLRKWPIILPMNHRRWYIVRIGDSDVGDSVMLVIDLRCRWQNHVLNRLPTS